MNKYGKATSWLLGALFLTLSFFIQLFLLIRYLDQNPNDTIGIILFTITTFSFALTAFGFTLQWKKLKTS